MSQDDPKCTECGLSEAESAAPIAEDGRCLLCWGKNKFRQEIDYIYLVQYHVRNILDDWASLTEEEKEFCVHEVAQGVACSTYPDRPFVARFKGFKCPFCTYIHHDEKCQTVHAQMQAEEQRARDAWRAKKAAKDARELASVKKDDLKTVSIEEATQQLAALLKLTQQMSRKDPTRTRKEMP